MRMRQTFLAVWIGWLCVASAGAQEALTFFGWSDQHVTLTGEADHLLPAVDAMNALEGTPWPEGIGGKVARPAFVFGCGDITEWPTNAAKNAYNDIITTRLKIPAYDIAGNHDDGGNAPSVTMHQWIIARHGALSYTFEKSGVHFLAVYSEYDESLNNPAQPVSANALRFIRESLAKVPDRKPVVVALHLCFDAITNRDELIKAFGDANVILVLGGHYHKATVHDYRGHRFVQLPSPQTTTLFTVFRIEEDRLVAIPYDYKAKAWHPDRRTHVDVKLDQKKSS